MSKLQANIKGFLFRQRRKKALLNLGVNNDMDEFEEVDMDKYFDMKEEALDSGLSLPE